MAGLLVPLPCLLQGWPWAPGLKEPLSTPSLDCNPIIHQSALITYGANAPPRHICVLDSELIGNKGGSLGAPVMHPASQ